MKSVEAQTAWRDATTKDRGFRATNLRTTDKRPLADFAAELPNGLTVVCGLNGVGKTTLLRLLLGALGGRSTDLREDLLGLGEFEVSLEIAGNEHVASLDDGQGVPVILLDAAEECTHLYELARQPNFGDLAEGFDPRDWSRAEIEEARYVIGKDYSAIRVTEIEDPAPVGPLGGEEETLPQSEAGDHATDASEDDLVLALIEVEVDGLTYDFRTMGLGELAALILLWRLRRVESGTVVLMEEPETYLSARAATSLLDVVAKTVHSRRLYALVTTHSPGLIRGAPLSSIRLLAGVGGATQLRIPESSPELELLLGLPSGPARIVLVEDHMAMDFVTEIIGRYAGPMARNLTFLRTGGWEPLLAICNKFPPTEAVHLVGVLDGDEFARAGQSNWPVVALPGPENPDALLRAAVTSNVSMSAELLSRSEEHLAAALEAHAGLDEHDWFHEVARTLGLNIHGFRRAAVGIWLEQPANEAQARGLVEHVIEGVALAA